MKPDHVYKNIIFNVSLQNFIEFLILSSIRLINNDKIAKICLCKHPTIGHPIYPSSIASERPDPNLMSFKRRSLCYCVFCHFVKTQYLSVTMIDFYVLAASWCLVGKCLYIASKHPRSRYSQSHNAQVHNSLNSSTFIMTISKQFDYCNM